MNLVANSKKFFEVISNCTEGQAFTSPCNLVFDTKLGIHQIENPQWFKPERCNSLYTWVAAILEENLWANFHYYESKLQQTDKQQATVDYLFDHKELEVPKQTQLLNIGNLTNAWLNASAEQRKEVTESLLTFKTITQQLEQIAPRRLKDVYGKRDFFMSETRFNDIDESVVQYVVEKSVKLSNKQKFYLTYEFVAELGMSMLQTVETPRDVVHRHMLLLIKDMH